MLALHYSSDLPKPSLALRWSAALSRKYALTSNVSAQCGYRYCFAPGSSMAVMEMHLHASPRGQIYGVAGSDMGGSFALPALCCGICFGELISGL